MNFFKTKKFRVVLIVVTVVMILASQVVFADDDWGQNSGQWALNQIWWIALAIVAFVAVKLMMKKMWVQLGGFMVLGGLVLFFVKFPDKLLYIGQTIYKIVTGQG